MHGCGPKFCRCYGQSGLIRPFPAELYLNPMVPVVEEASRKILKLVTTHSEPTCVNNLLQVDRDIRVPAVPNWVKHQLMRRQVLLTFVDVALPAG